MVILAVASGCASLTPRPSGLQRKIGGTEMSPSALRLRIRDLASRYSGEIEVASDELARTTDDPQDRIAYLRFKANGVPQMQQALLRADPVMALIDAWALVLQLRQALGALAQRGKVLSPEQLSLVNARFVAMDEELAGIWQDLTGRKDISATRKRIYTWALEHPLDSLVTRTSTVPLYTELTSRAGVQPLPAAAAYLLEDTQDLAQRMDLISGFMPRQARWEAELFTRQLMVDRSLMPGAGTPAEVATAASRLVLLADQIPEMLSDQKDGVVRSVDDLRVNTESFLSREREQIMGAIHRERVEGVAQAGQISEALLDRAFEHAGALVDRVFRWLLLLAAVFGLLLVVAALIFTRRGARRPLEVRRTVVQE